MPELQQTLKFLFAFLLLAAPVRTLSARVDESSLREDVEMLCSESFAGRSFSSGNTVLASMMIARRFAEAGVPAPDGGRFQCFRDDRGICGRNVVGVLKGRSAKTVVIGAYYDGLGMLGGRLYPGADSNASGVAMLLAIAEELASGPALQETLVFVAFDGHYSACAGASAFASSMQLHPALMLNLDTVGSSLAPVKRAVPDYLIALGGERWSRGLEAAAARAGITLYYDYYGSRAFTDMFYRASGDHKPFMDEGVPCVMFTSGITNNTNRVGDQPSSLDYPLMRRRSSLLCAWLQKLDLK